MNANAQQPHARCLPRGAPEEDEVRARDQQPAGGKQRAYEPLRRNPPTSDAISAASRPPT